MATTFYTHRIDSDLRVQCEAVYSALGMLLGTAINVFLKKTVPPTLLKKVYPHASLVI